MESNDEATEHEDDPAEDAGPASVRIASPEVETSWIDVLDLARDPVKPSFGPKTHRLTKRWGGASAASAFRALRPDPCLHQAFDDAKKSNKTLVESSSVFASASGASAHAILAASEKLEKFIGEISSVVCADEQWMNYFAQAASSLKMDVLFPLKDAVSLQASIYGKAVSTVRTGVVAAAAAPVKSALKDIPPSGGFFFGDPAERLSANMQYAYMAKQLASSSSSSRGGRGGSSASFRPPPSKSSSSSSKSSSTPSASSSSSAKNRPFRGGKGGKTGK